MKKILVIIKSNFLNNLSCIEGLRIALGLSLSKNVTVSVLLWGEGVYFVLKNNPAIVDMPDIDQSFELLEASNVDVMADSGSLERQEISIQREFVTPVSHDKVLQKIGCADAVLSF